MFGGCLDRAHSGSSNLKIKLVLIVINRDFVQTFVVNLRENCYGEADRNQCDELFHIKVFFKLNDFLKATKFEACSFFDEMLIYMIIFHHQIFFCWLIKRVKTSYKNWVATKRAKTNQLY